MYSSGLGCRRPSARAHVGTLTGLFFGKDGGDNGKQYYGGTLWSALFWRGWPKADAAYSRRFLGPLSAALVLSRALYKVPLLVPCSACCPCGFLPCYRAAASCVKALPLLLLLLPYRAGDAASFVVRLLPPPCTAAAAAAAGAVAF